MVWEETGFLKNKIIKQVGRHAAAVDGCGIGCVSAPNLFT